MDKALAEGSPAHAGIDPFAGRDSVRSAPRVRATLYARRLLDHWSDDARRYDNRGIESVGLPYPAPRRRPLAASGGERLARAVARIPYTSAHRGELPPVLPHAMPSTGRNHYAG